MGDVGMDVMRRLGENTRMLVERVGEETNAFSSLRKVRVIDGVNAILRTWML
jgi:hypothetical protein